MGGHVPGARHRSGQRGGDLRAPRPPLGSPPLTTQARFAAFAAIYADQQRPVWAYLVRLGATAAVAEDLGQEAFVKWLNHSKWVDEPEQARAFLFTTATRLLVSHWRRERRLVAWDSTVSAPSVEPAADGLLSGEAWAALSRRERQLLWLAYAEEFSHAEIAGITDLAPASIKVLLSRARARLKASLTPRETPDE